MKISCICLTYGRTALLNETAGDSVEIIVVDDGSPVPLTLEDKNVVLRRIDGRAGVGPARHIAATLASRPYLLFLDAHMMK